jgi:hypothetical protein
MAPPKSSSTSSPPRPFQVALGLSAAGALLVLLGLFGTAVAVAGVVAAIAGTVLAAPYADRPAAINGWWSLLAAGAVLATLGVGIGLAVESLGGLLRVLGGVLLAIAVAFAYPSRG